MRPASILRMYRRNWSRISLNLPEGKRFFNFVARESLVDPRYKTHLVN